MTSAGVSTGAASPNQEDEITASLTAQERTVLLGLLQTISAGLGMSPGVHPKLAEG